MNEKELAPPEPKGFALACDTQGDDITTENGESEAPEPKDAIRKEEVQ